MSSPSCRIGLLILCLVMVTSRPALPLQVKETKIATIAYTHGYKSGADGVKVHLRFNADEEPGDRPTFIWPLSSSNPTWVLVPQFSADLGNQDDVAPNNIIAAVDLQTVGSISARRVHFWKAGLSWQSARDYSTSLLLAGGALVYDWFAPGYYAGKNKIAVEVGVRAEVGPRFIRGDGPEPVTFRLTPKGSLQWEKVGSRLSGKLVLSGTVFAFANDDLRPDTVTHYTDEVLGLGSVGLELRPARPNRDAPAKPVKWPVSFVAKYTYGHKPPVFKLQNVLELGARLYWTPPAP